MGTCTGLTNVHLIRPEPMMPSIISARDGRVARPRFLFAPCRLRTRPAVTTWEKFSECSPKKPDFWKAWEENASIGSCSQKEYKFF
jgi:hypothetical protein